MKSNKHNSDPKKLAFKYTPEDYDLPYPWAMGRSEVLAGRNTNRTFRLQEQIIELEESTREEVEKSLGDSVAKSDLREAALILGYSQPEKLIKFLSAWVGEHA